jgi:hypothetical protein
MRVRAGAWERTIAALAAAGVLACRTTAPAPPNPALSCVIVGGPGAPAELRIYDADPYGSPAGRRLFAGLLNYREQHGIQSRDGTIWYAYLLGGAWREGNVAPCRDGAQVALP